MPAQATNRLQHDSTAARGGPTTPIRGRAYWIRTVAFWILTVLVVGEMAAGSLWDLFRIEYVRVIMTHLGYPLFLLSILGVWKLAGAVVVTLPRFPLVKEWAYAGFFFNYSGAAASHWLSGDGPDRWAAPLVLAALTIGSWALRPADRRLQSAHGVAPETGLLDWAIPIAGLVLIFVLSYFTLPTGPPPGY